MEDNLPKTIFLSYSWSDDIIANDIDSIFTNAGLKIIRDRKDLNYKDSVKDFMRKINDTSYVILLISNAYLESSNCMFEVLELLKDPNYKKRILPIILHGVNIFKTEGRIALIKYWENKISESNSSIKELHNLANVGTIINDIEHFTRIRYSIDNFISTLTDLNSLNFSLLEKENYKPILDFIGYSEESIEVKILEIITIHDIEKREIEINSLLNQYPNQINLLLLRGNLALEKNQNHLAITYFSGILTQYPNLPEVHNNLGIAYKKLEQFKYAINEFDKSIRINPESSAPYINLGLLYSENILDYEKAKYNFETSLKLDSNVSEAHFGYANFLYDQRYFFNQNRDFLKILHHYIEAIRLVPTATKNEVLSNIHFNFANFLLEYNDLFSAKKQYQFCIQYSANHYLAHCNLAVVLRRLGEFELSKNHYDIALDINPLDVISQNNLANLLFENLKNFPLADYHYKKAQKIDPFYKPENYERFKKETGFI